MCIFNVNILGKEQFLSIFSTFRPSLQRAASELTSAATRSPSRARRSSLATSATTSATSSTCSRGTRYGTSLHENTDQRQMIFEYLDLRNQIKYSIFQVRHLLQKGIIPHDQLFNCDKCPKYFTYVEQKVYLQPTATLHVYGNVAMQCQIRDMFST